MNRRGGCGGGGCGKRVCSPAGTVRLPAEQLQTECAATHMCLARQSCTTARRLCAACGSMAAAEQRQRRLGGGGERRGAAGTAETPAAGCGDRR